MKTTQHLMLIAVAAFTFTACSKSNRIDASSDEALKKSSERMQAGLSEPEKEQLSKDMMAVAMEGTDLFQVAASPELAKQRLRDKLNGKSKQEIEALAADIRAKAEKKNQEQKAERKKQVESEIADLKAEMEKAASDTKSLSDFKVLSSRFYFDKDRFSTKPVIEIKVRNDLKSAISAVSFEGILKSPGRSVPWVKDNFSYKISGGLEPAEEATWQLAPNQFGDWGKAPKDRNDMILTVSVRSVQGPDEKPLFQAEFPEEKIERLKSLIEALEKGSF